MATVLLRGHRRKIELVTGMAAHLVPRANLLRMMLDEGLLRKIIVPWWKRAWRRVVRAWAAVWACVTGRASQAKY